MITALENGQCPADQTHAVHKLKAPKNNDCPLCDESFERYVDLQIHVRSHVAQLPGFFEPVIPPQPYSLSLSARLLAAFRSRRGAPT